MLLDMQPAKRCGREREAEVVPVAGNGKLVGAGCTADRHRAHRKAIATRTNMGARRPRRLANQRKIFRDAYRNEVPRRFGLRLNFHDVRSWLRT